MERLRAQPADEAVLGLMGLEITRAQLRKLQSQEIGKVVNLPALRAQQVRDGPIRSRAKRAALFRDVDRQAA